VIWWALALGLGPGLAILGAATVGRFWQSRLRGVALAYGLVVAAMILLLWSLS
jgi:hypothetical protein